MDQQNQEKSARSYVGKVVSASRDKTVTVVFERRVKHPLYGKVVKRFTKYHAHDESNQCKVGDVVEIIETKPLAKTKFFSVKSIISGSKATVA